jgi:hypothetical protein
LRLKLQTNLNFKKKSIFLYLGLKRRIELEEKEQNKPTCGQWRAKLLLPSRLTNLAPSI